MKRAVLVLLRAIPGAALLTLALLGAVSCGKDEVKLVLLDPCGADGGVSFREQSVFTEILIVEGGCPQDPELASGDVKKVVTSKIVSSSSPSLPAIGDLEEGKYGFVVLLKDASCGVIGFGCTAADMANIREVRVAVRAWTNSNTCQPLSGGSCPAPKECDTDTGRCVGQATPSDAGGVGCDLTVVKAGKLPNPALSGATVSGINIVSTTSGFAIGYREQSSDTLNAVVVPLSDSGVLGSPSRAEQACAATAQSDGIGMAWNGDQGFMVTTVPVCSGASGAGAWLIPFDASGTIAGTGLPVNPAFQSLDLARLGSLAPGLTENEWEFVYSATLDGVPEVQRAIVRGTTVVATPPITALASHFGSNPSYGMVATSSEARAFVGNVTTEGGSSTVAKLSRVIPTDDDTAFPKIVGEMVLPGGSFAAAHAWDDRVIVAVPQGSDGFVWSVAQVLAGGGDGGGSVSPVVTDAPAKVGSLQGLDVEVHGDNLLFAVGQTSKITVYRLLGATGTISLDPENSRELSGSVATGVSLASFDGQRMALAAGRSRAAVAWVTSDTTSLSEPIGGWAVLQCAK